MAILVNNGTDTLINTFMILASLIGFFRIRHLDFDEECDQQNTDTTIIVTAFGMFAYSTFTVIAGLLNPSHNLYEPRELIVTNGIVEMIQVLKDFFSFLWPLWKLKFLRNGSNEIVQKY